VRIRKLRLFTLVFIIGVLVAAYGLALLRTYVFKPPPASSGNSRAFVSIEWVTPGPQKLSRS